MPPCTAIDPWRQILNWKLGDGEGVGVELDQEAVSVEAGVPEA